MLRLSCFLAWFDLGLSVGVTAFSSVLSNRYGDPQSRGIQPANVRAALDTQGGSFVFLRVNLRVLGFSSHALAFSASVLRGFSR